MNGLHKYNVKIHTQEVLLRSFVFVLDNYHGTITINIVFMVRIYFTIGTRNFGFMVTKASHAKLVCL